MTRLPEKPDYIPISHASITPLMVNTPVVLIYLQLRPVALESSRNPKLTRLKTAISNCSSSDISKYRDDYSLWGDKETGFCFHYIPKPIIPEVR